VPRRTGRSPFGSLRGNVSAVPSARPSQDAAQGQRPQSGLRGVQTVAPRSISACAKSPARAAGSISSTFSRTRRFACRKGAAMAWSRAITRSTLPSIAAEGASKAIAAIAPAV